MTPDSSPVMLSGRRHAPVPARVPALLTLALALAFAPAPAHAHAWPTPADVAAPAEDPPCSMSLTLPQTALELRLEYRQLGPDLARYLEPQGVDAVDLHQLQVMSLLAQGSKLKTGVTLRVGGHVFKPATYSMGFTVALGGALRFFLVDGTEAVPLPSLELDPGWVTERLVMHLEYAARTSVRLVWHLGAKAGRIDLGLGGSAPETAPESAPEAEPAPGAPAAPVAPGGAGLPVKPLTPPVKPSAPGGGGSVKPPVEPPATVPKAALAAAPRLLPHADARLPLRLGLSQTAQDGAPRCG